MSTLLTPPRLKLLARETYTPLTSHDPLNLYYWPMVGPLYRRRVELCLAECAGGGRVLEVGCGCGVTFLNLSELYREIYGIDLESRTEDTKAVFDRLGIHTDLRNGDVTAMPYPDGHFDTVLLISILEHLKRDQLDAAFAEIRRVLRPGGQVVYGVPVERPLMVLAFRLMGYNIREHHFSTEKDVAAAAGRHLAPVRLRQMRGAVPGVGAIYEVGHFVKQG